MTTSQDEKNPKRMTNIGPIDQLVALRKVKDNGSSIQEFESVKNPFPLGNANSVLAYGGFCVSVAIASAFQSLPQTQLTSLNIYSVQASFLGPTRLDAPVRLEVTTLRETRTFSTRMVLVKQDQGHKDKNTGIPILRSTLAFLIDFVATKGDRTIEGMVYGEQPAYDVTDHSALPTIQQRYIQEVKAGRLEEGVVDAVNEATKHVRGLYEQKFTPEGLSWDNLAGVLSDNVTKQDDRKTTDKVSYDWIRYSQENVSSIQNGSDILYPPNERASAACFYGLLLDGYLSFLPLVFTHRYLFDADACSSLDLSLRFHVDDLRVGLWNLREMRTISGQDERTFSQSRLWQKADDRSNTEEDGKDKFKLIATMTQSSVMRDFEKEKSRI